MRDGGRESRGAPIVREWNGKERETKGPGTAGRSEVLGAGCSTIERDLCFNYPTKDRVKGGTPVQEGEQREKKWKGGLCLGSPAQEKRVPS